MTTSLDKVNAKGEFKRAASSFRNWIEPEGRFRPESGRYHLYVSLACPWAAGCLSMLYLKGLEKVVSYSVVAPTWQRTRPNIESDQHCGWVFGSPGDAPLSNALGHGSLAFDDACTPDQVNGCATLRDVYELDNAPLGTVYSTPMLWDKKEGAIVNNESTEILRMFNDGFGLLAANASVDLFPAEFSEELMRLNDTNIYPNINNGVYRCGFATTQAAYDEAIGALYRALDEVESLLAKRRFLVGDRFTWLDLRLYHTLVRFDPVYVVYFKTNLRLLREYPNLLGFVRDVYSIPAVKRTTNMRHIKAHYFTSHAKLNTFAIIPASDGPDLTVPSGRESLATDSIANENTNTAAMSRG